MQVDYVMVQWTVAALQQLFPAACNGIRRSTGCKGQEAAQHSNLGWECCGTVNSNGVAAAAAHSEQQHQEQLNNQQEWQHQHGDTASAIVGLADWLTECLSLSFTRLRRHGAWRYLLTKNVSHRHVTSCCFADSMTGRYPTILVKTDGLRIDLMIETSSNSHRKV